MQNKCKISFPDEKMIKITGILQEGEISF